MGMAQENVEVGDEIFVLANAPMPFILKSANKEYQLDAQTAPLPVYKMNMACYVHGIMDGEAVDGRYEGMFGNVQGASKVILLE
jgi:hypothetical protein